MRASRGPSGAGAAWDRGEVGTEQAALGVVVGGGQMLWRWDVGASGSRSTLRRRRGGEGTRESKGAPSQGWRSAPN